MDKVVRGEHGTHAEVAAMRELATEATSEENWTNRSSDKRCNTWTMLGILKAAIEAAA